MVDAAAASLSCIRTKIGFVFVYDRANAKVQNVWRIAKSINFVKDIDPKTNLS